VLSFFTQMPKQAWPIVIAWAIIFLVSIILRMAGLGVSLWLTALVSVFVTMVLVYFAIRHRIPQIRRRLGL
jgi:hypothetical protein